MQEEPRNLFCGLSFVNIPVHCNVKVFIWLYPSLPVQLSFILERSVGSRKRGPVCPEPRLLSSTKHSAGFKGECSLGSQVLISLQTDMLLNSLKCQKRWVYLSCWSSWLRMASWATHLHRWPTGHLLHIIYHQVREFGMSSALHTWFVKLMLDGCKWDWWAEKCI